MTAAEWLGVAEFEDIELTAPRHAAWIVARGRAIAASGSDSAPAFRVVVLQPRGELWIVHGSDPVLEVPAGQWRYAR